MGTYNATWEDEDNNRQIHFSVAYSTENGTVTLESVTPTKVSFICPETNTCLRSVGVHTSAGRGMLGKYVVEHADMDRLKSEIATRIAEPVVA